MREARKNPNDASAVLRFAMAHVGDRENEPANPALAGAINVLQALSSLAAVASFVTRVYTDADDLRGVDAADAALAVVWLLCGLYRIASKEFEAADFATFVDCVTCASAWAGSSGDPGASTACLTYLRALTLPTLVEALRSLGLLHRLSEFQQSLLASFLRFATLVVGFAGTLLVLEALGEVEGFADQFHEFGMGNLSFFQMCYFVFVTISTVGYGDFTPTTVFSRLFIFVVIGGGVVFFSQEAETLVTEHQKRVSGRGAFKPRIPQRGHVVLMGGAVRNSNLQALSALLDELCHPQQDARDVVTVANQPPSEQLLAFLSQRWCSRVQWYLGDPTVRADTERVRVGDAAMVLVVVDTTSNAPDEEDQENVLRAAALHKRYPEVPLRVLLMRPENVMFAKNCGLPPLFVYAMNELKAAVMAQSVRLPGFGSVVLNLGAAPSREAVPPEVLASPWARQFLAGAEQSLFGLQLAARFDGRAFAAAAREVHAETGALLLAMQINGRLAVNPGSSRIAANVVVFAVALSEAQLDPVRRDEADRGGWIAALRAARKASVVARTDPDDTDAIQAGRGEAQDQFLGVQASATQNKRRLVSFKSVARVLPMLPPALNIGLGRRAAGGQTQFVPDEQGGEDDGRGVLSSVAPPGVERRGHVVVVLPDRHGWQQLMTFLNELRSESFVFADGGTAAGRVVVVLCSAEPPENVAQLASDMLVFLSGNCTRLRYLYRASIDHAYATVVLAGPPPTQEPGMMDQNNVIMTSLMEMRSWGRVAHSVLDIYSLHNLSQMPNLTLAHLEGAEGPVEVDNLTVQRVELEEFPHHIHPRVASGQAFCATELLRSVALAVYRPGVLELMQALAQPAGQAQESTMVPLRVPRALEGREVEALWEQLEGLDCLVLALHRVASYELGNTHPFVVTNPPRHITLRVGDTAMLSLRDVGRLSELRQRVGASTTPAAAAAPAKADFSASGVAVQTHR